MSNAKNAENLSNIIKSLQDISESIGDYGENSENYIIHADHIKEIIDALEGIVESIGINANTDISGLINIDNKRGTEANIINESTVSYDNLTIKDCIERLKNYIDAISYAMQNNLLMTIDLSADKITGQLKSSQISLSGNEALDALKIYIDGNANGNNKITIADAITSIKNNIKDIKSDLQITEKENMTIKNLKTSNSDFVGVASLVNNSINTDYIKIYSDNSYPSSFENILLYNHGTDAEVDRLNDVLTYEKEFAYGNYDLTLRARGDMDPNDNKVKIQINIFSDNVKVGCWQILSGALQKEGYQSFNIPFQHNGAFRELLGRKIKINIQAASTKDESILFDYLSINPVTTTLYNKFEEVLTANNTFMLRN